MHHVGTVVSNFEKASGFYDAVLAPLGGKRIVTFGKTALYGNAQGVFFSITEKEKHGHREHMHYAFSANSTKEVDEWYEACIKHGAKDNGKPGPRPAYGPNFYGAFVHEPLDGVHLECCFKHLAAAEGEKIAPAHSGFDHVGLLTSDLTKAQTFYDAILGALHSKRVMNFPTGSLYAGPKNGIMLGITQVDKEHAAHRDGEHYAFYAETHAEVDAWYEAAIKHGAKDNGKPGLRPAYGPNFYGAWALDPIDGIHLEACCTKPQGKDAEEKKASKDAKPTLYLFFGTRAMRPAWMANELGVQLDIKWVNLREGEHKKPEYLKLNPYGTVPTLVDGDQIFTNSVSSTMHLALKHNPKYIKKDNDLEMLTSLDRWDDVVIKALLNKVVYPEAARNPQVVKDNHATWEAQILPHWERIIAKAHPWLGGEQFTVDDVVFGYIVNCASMLGWLEGDKHKALHDYASRCQQRPAFKTTYDRSNAAYPPLPK